MNNLKRALAAVALAGATFAVAAPAYADIPDGDSDVVTTDSDSTFDGHTAKGTVPSRPMSATTPSPRSRAST
jgi:hypothetical protein